MAGKKKPLKVHNWLADLRNRLGLSAAGLASTIDVSRQTIYAMESGDYATNTSVALRLAQTLGMAVEKLFQLEATRLRLDAPLVRRTSPSCRSLFGRGGSRWRAAIQNRFAPLLTLDDRTFPL